jgi:RNA polymerase-binding transcription factor DksA
MTLTDTQRQTLRDLLAQRKLALEEEVAAPRAKRERGERVHEVQDRKDEADDEAQATTDDAEQQRDVDELEQIVAAQQRMAEGSYGECEDCGETIDIRRLLVLPAARRCADCQAERERRPPGR